MKNNKNKWSPFCWLKSVMLVVLFVLWVVPAWAFLFEVPILEKEQITTLSDEALKDNFVEVLVEAEAVKAFFSKGGLLPKEFNKFKALLRYKILLVMEMQKRKLEIPSYNP